MPARHLLVILLALPSLATAKDELIPTKERTRDRQEKQQNPLNLLADDMNAVARLLRVEKTGDATQDRQKTIIDKLDQLIEMARQQSQQPPKGGQDQQKKKQQQQKKKPQPSQQKKKQQQKKKTAQQEKEQRNRPGFGPAGKGEGTGKLHTDAQEWGDLPPKIRDQLLNIEGEGFPLKYRELLRRYYRELAKPRD